ncbi:SLAP domain protein [Lactobacillus kimbladii]|uniref:SLAP domain protein n=2 Tax=Lactobacillus kimbladii TaxID=1218506 RepID=A0A0F4LKM6_9LACO|nr:SLAP domain protein [Lactobacillus kimbladii]
MKKNSILIGLATAALLSVGAIGITGNVGVSSPQTVQAAKKGYKITLKHNAYVYSKHGHRKGRKTLKKGKTLTAYRKVKIKGKKFYKLSKGRYLKAGNVKTINSSAKVPVTKPVGQPTTPSSTTTSSKTFKVTVTSPARIYDGKGNKTPFTANQGSAKTVIGSKVINGAKYYQIGNDSYILASLATPGASSDDSNREQEGNSTNKDGLGVPDVKPTQAEVDHILANNNDKLGYTVYFSDNELAEIKDYLWQDIQSYRVENGLPKYKKNNELDTFVSKVTYSSSTMNNYQSHINSTTAHQLASYLPSLAQNGMDVTDSFDVTNYYGQRMEGDELPKSFNFKDRNTKHVATQIFNSFKEQLDYNSIILGDNDKEAFASLGLHYEWHGASSRSSVGIVFIEVSGSSSKWSEYYNAN